MKNVCASILMACAAAAANTDHTLYVKQIPAVAIEGRNAQSSCTAGEAAACFFAIDKNVAKQRAGVTPAELLGSGSDEGGVSPSEGMAMRGKAALVKSGSAGLNAITGWGDSLTVGGQDHLGDSYLKSLSALSGQPVNNEGAGAQTSTQTAVRQGAIPTSVTVSGGFIPTSGSVTVTFPAGHEPAIYQTAPPGVLGTIAGVEGYTLDNHHQVYVFTPTAYPASPVAVSPGSAWLPAVGRLNTGLCVIWAGRNNYPAVSQVESDVAAMVAKCVADGADYVVLSVINGEYQYEWSSGSQFPHLTTLAASLAATYPGHFIDIRSALVNSYDPSNVLDAIDFKNNVPPFSKRAIISSGGNPTRLSSGIGSSDTTIALAPGVVTVKGFQVGRIGSEYVFCTGASGTAWTGCTRGYGGTTAASHLSGTVVSVTDPIHLGAAGYEFVAQQIWKWMSSRSSVPSPSTAK